MARAVSTKKRLISRFFRDCSIATGADSKIARQEQGESTWDPLNASELAPNSANGLIPSLIAWAKSRHGSKAGHSSGVADVDARRRRPRSDADALGARWLSPAGPPAIPLFVTREDPRVEPCLILCGPSWSLSRLPAGLVLRSPLLVRLEMASICMHDTPRNATFSGFFENFGGSNSRRKSVFSNDLYPCFS